LNAHKQESGPGSGPKPWPRAVAAVLAAAAVLAGGALGVGALRRAGSPARTPQAALADKVPPPPGSRLILSRVEKANAVFRYLCDAPPEAVSDFYRLAMPAQGWRERAIGEEDLAADMLAFSLGARLCMISLGRRETAPGATVTVVINDLRGGRSPSAPYKEKTP